MRAKYLISTMLAVGVILAGGGVVDGATEDAPRYGAWDFYPSDERPVGFLADLNGHFPGATPPDFEALGTNCVVWEREMETPGMAAPLVVGEKVFVLGDYFELYCLNAHDGSLLWQRTLSPSLDMPPPLAEGFEQELAYHDDCQTLCGQWWLRLEKVAKQCNAKLRDIMVYHGRNASVEHPCTVVTNDAAINAEIAELRALQRQYNFGEGYQGAPITSGVSADGLWKPWGERCRHMYNLCTWDEWYGWLTFAYMQPCSDGQYVYVPFMANQMACVSVDGEIEWLRWLPNDVGDPRSHTRYVKSPCLSGDTLLWRADNCLIAIDKHTGAERWRKEAQSGGVSIRPSPESGQMALMNLPLDDGSELRLVIDPLGIFYRVEDGKRLGGPRVESEAKSEFPRSGFRSAYLTFGDVLIARVKMGKKRADAVAVRVSARDRETLVFEEIWRVEKCSYSGIRCHDKAYLGVPGRGRQAGLVDALTGAYDESALIPCRHAYGWSVIAGDQVIDWGVDKKNRIGSHRFGAIPLTIRTLDVRTGTHASTPPLIDRRWAEDRDFWVRWTYRGNVKFVANASITPQANRLFMRSLGATRCLGNPAETFPVSEAWPARARVGANAEHRTSNVEHRSAERNSMLDARIPLDQVVEALSTGSQDRRAAAVRTLSDLSDKSDLSDQTIAALIAAHAEAVGARRNDLARALGTIGPAAAAAAQALATDVVEADRGMAVSAGWALSRLGKAAADGMGPITAWLDENAGRAFDRGKAEVPIKRFMAIGMAVGGVMGVDALNDLVRRAHDRNRTGLGFAKGILDGSLLEGADHPAPWPTGLRPSAADEVLGSKQPRARKIEALIELTSGCDGLARTAAVRGLAAMAGADIVEALIRVLEVGGADARSIAVSELGGAASSKAAREQLVRALGHEHPMVREQVLAALAKQGSGAAEALPVLVAMAHKAHPDVRCMLGQAIVRLVGKDPKALPDDVMPALFAATHGKDVNCAAAAMDIVVGMIGDRGPSAETLESLADVMHVYTPNIGCKAEKMLVGYGAVAVPALVRVLKTGDTPWGLQRAARSLGAIGEPGAIPALEALLGRNVHDIAKNAARKSIETLSGADASKKDEGDR